MGTKLALGVLAVAVVFALFLPLGKESRTVVERVGLGAANSPDLNIGGVLLTSSKTTSLIQATTTVICSLQSPAATSSLVFGSLQLTSATSGVSSLSLSRSSVPYTVGALVLASTSVASGAQGLVTHASGTPFAPNTYLVGMQAGAGVVSPTGACQALWTPLN